ncbi:hypothetical protein CVU82_01125 [Candidatus Falkowbacteria bacterium HGW-Falkowbacteria-1]|uniref:Prepilin-type N-terminal cleavage/methylation domain-containing protein n=1 Tax=Candidatus Falkowbacteria bacterium HGW-Falkowbacteria-1 TaxID=2013768 RepID=A0A2N2EAM9_9BACT|nr:MAG: hypothetical protein CVU82_01125 [Candidatus Falkowbacteria bacterium HGW-Falkowbacteria-1]
MLKNKKSEYEREIFLHWPATWKSGASLRGFTLIEVLVSLSIIVVLSSLLVVNYKTGSRQSNLSSFHSSLFQDLEATKWKAINSQQYGGELPVYWGVYLEKGLSSYKIFADLNGNFIIDDGEDDISLGAKNFDFLSSSIINDINLGDRVSILFSTEDGFPIFYDIDGDIISGDDLIIEIRDGDFNFGKLIFLNSFALVDFADCFCSVGYENQCSWCE